MAYDTEKTVAIKAALAAAQLCETVRNQISPEAIEKKDKSPVTIADFGAQAVICRAVDAVFPDDPIVGEEDTTDLRQPEMSDRLDQIVALVKAIESDATPDGVLEWIDRGNGQVSPRYWTLDPIDGTKGFLRKDQYAIALALIESGEVKLGVMACPALTFDKAGSPGLLFVAVRGEGATMVPFANGEIVGEPQPLKVVSANQADGFRLVESMESGHGDHSRQESAAKAVGITQESLRMDSQAKYGAVAAGKAALYLRLPSPKSPDYREKIWDHAAGAIVVEEAGGRVTDMFGKPLDFANAARMMDNQGVVVSNGDIHDEIIQTLGQ
ncbi:MAG: 3'(2'),5'-bisphosphate nucleotidase [Elainellaceae cyanobacterium]